MLYNVFSVEGENDDEPPTPLQRLGDGGQGPNGHGSGTGQRPSDPELWPAEIKTRGYVYAPSSAFLSLDRSCDYHNIYGVAVYYKLLL